MHNVVRVGKIKNAETAFDRLSKAKIRFNDCVRHVIDKMIYCQEEVDIKLVRVEAAKEHRFDTFNPHGVGQCPAEVALTLLLSGYSSNIVHILHTKPLFHLREFDIKVMGMRRCFLGFYQSTLLTIDSAPADLPDHYIAVGSAEY